MTTKQTSAFVYLIDSIAELLPEISVNISGSGMYIAQATLYASIFVSAVLNAESFDLFTTTGDTTICIQTKLLLTVLKTSNICDTLTLSYDQKRPAILLIQLQANERVSRCYEIPVARTADKGPGMVISDEFAMTAHMNSAHMRHVITNLVPFTDYITIRLAENNICFSFCHTDLISRGRITIGDRGSPKGATVQSTYRASSLALFAKCIALHPVCNLYMSNDYPMMLEILVNELGKLTLHLVHTNAE